jgi:hypothetical protein
MFMPFSSERLYAMLSSLEIYDGRSPEARPIACFDGIEAVERSDGEADLRPALAGRDVARWPPRGYWGQSCIMVFRAFRPALTGGEAGMVGKKGSAVRFVYFLIPGDRQSCHRFRRRRAGRGVFCFLEEGARPRRTTFRASS